MIQASIIVLIPNILPTSQRNMHGGVKGDGGAPSVGGVGGFKPSWSQCPVRLQPEDWRRTLILDTKTQTYALLDTKTGSQRDNRTCTHTYSYTHTKSRDYTWPTLTSRAQSRLDTE